MTMIRKVMPAQVNALGDDEVEVIMSTGTLARDGHVLVPSGVQLDAYRRNPIILWQHDPEHPVGRAEDVRVDGDKIVARIRFAPAGISHKADEIRGLVKSGIVCGVSVGFEPMDGEPLDPKKPRGGLKISEWELLECSFCSVPVDTGATVTARAITDPEEDAGMTDKTAETDRLKGARTRMLVASPGKPKFRGLYDVAQLAYALQNLGYIQASADWESDIEGDDSPVPAMLGEALKSVGEALIAMTSEEVDELIASAGVADAIEEAVLESADRAYVQAAKTPRARALRVGLVAAHIRAGRTLSAGNVKKLSDADGHHDKALERHKAATKQQDTTAEHQDAIGTAQSKAAAAHDKLGAALQSAQDEPDKASDHIATAVRCHRALGKQIDGIGDHHEAATESHGAAADEMTALGRSVRSAQRCVRSVLDGATPGAEDGDVKDVQTSDGTGEDKGARSLNFRRRQADALALANEP